MTTLTIIIGLPGSGKSHHLNQLVNEGKVSADCIAHDYHANAINNSSAPEHSRHYASIIDHLRNGNDCAIADIAFCDAERLQNVELSIYIAARGTTIKRIYFENNAENCKWNVHTDGGEGMNARLQAIDRFTAIYTIPDDSDIIPVVKKL